jgi:glycosyltransferase involved in cell wall biosynthesis
MSVLEGMASGLPCVITTGCNLPEAATAKVTQVVEIDAEAIASALTTCLKHPEHIRNISGTHPEKAKEMGDRARQFIFENDT